MCFDGALGYVQIASDFGVVASLEQEIDDLTLPGTYLAELLFHKCTAPVRCASTAASGANHAPSAHLDSGLCVSFCIHPAKIGLSC